MERYSIFTYSKIFSLNNFYGDVAIGESFNTPNVDVVPMMVEFDITKTNVPSGFSIDPSGFRHLTTHPTFKQILASGRDIVSMDFGPLDMRITNVSTGSGVSCTRCAIFRINKFDCDTTRIRDMKVWASDLSDFLTPETFEILFETRQAFPSGFAFDVNDLVNEDRHLPRSLPENQNLLRQDGGFVIAGSGDADVSEYMLFAVAASGVLPLGQYGGNLSGFNIRVTYNLDNLFNLVD
jgi:hypothetical protein